MRLLPSVPAPVRSDHRPGSSPCHPSVLPGSGHCPCPDPDAGSPLAVDSVPPGLLPSPLEGGE
eukprot:3028558-Rhodomonas_salina.4